VAVLAADVADGPGNVLPRYFRRYAPAVREAEKGGPAAAERHRSGPARLTVVRHRVGFKVAQARDRADAGRLRALIDHMRGRYTRLVLVRG
jgi:hypothetical protein